MSLARFSVRNPVPVNLLMIAVLVLGSIAFVALPRELMSDFSFNWVFISKPYPGVPAEEIEKLITIPIEDEIRDVKGIDYIASQSAEGSSFISVKLQQMDEEEFRARLQDLRSEVDKVKDLPADAMDTNVEAFGSADMMPLITVHIYGRAPEKKLLELARQLRDQLLLIPKTAKVQLMGAREREVWVEADPGKLRGFALSPQELQAAIRAHINVPAGRLKVGRQELLVRSLGEFASPAAVNKVIVRATGDGRKVRVSDVARVRDTFEEERTRNRLDGEPVISLTITKQNDGNSIIVTDQVKHVSREFERRHRKLIRIGVTQDSSEPIRDMLSKLSVNAWLGFTVVVGLLLLVLGLRNAVLAALGIPISFLACFIFMYQTGESFNGNSLFGLVLVLGIIVDDAIIIVENCYRHLEMGKSWREAAIVGTEEVTAPIFAATATTIAAFLPLILLPGIIGKFMRIVPVTVSLALIASMVEAFLILPSHFADWPGRRFQRKTERPWLGRLRASYERALRYVIRRRKRFVLGAVLLLPAAGAMVPLLGVNMFAGEEVNMFQVRVTMPTGTNLDVTARTLQDFEHAAAQLPRSEVRAVHSTAGLVMTDTDWFFRTDVGQLWLDLPMSYARERTTDAIMDDLRKRLLRIPGPTSIELAKVNTGPPLGKPVEVKVKGKYLEQLREVSNLVKRRLASIKGAIDIGDDFKAGKEEVRFKVDVEKAALYGLTVAHVGLALRTALEGDKVGRLFDADQEIDIMVKVDERFLDKPADLLRLPLLLHSGQTIFLGDVASYQIKAGIAEIRRYRNRRAITVFAGVDQSKNTTVQVNAALHRQLEDLPDRYPGVTLDYTGEWQEFKESFSALGKLFVFGVLLIYVILGAQFRSYLQPVVILFTVPFSFVGAIVGLAISGNPFSLITLFGMVALAGVAVNDAIVLISFANSAKAAGTDPEEAIVQAGCLRLRPIILTSLTTIAGLLPMAMGLGGMSLTWSPLANTIVWGLGVGTILMLLLIPAVYLLLVHDLPAGLARIFRRGQH